MPELPEVQALTVGLSELIVGQRIERVELASFSALKTVEPDIGGLAGRQVRGVDRRGKLVCVDTGGLWLVVHLARGGWITWHPNAPATTARPNKSKISLRIRLDGGGALDVTEMGTEKRLALWVVGSPDDVPQVAGLGVDPLGPGFTTEALAAILGGTTSTVKIALTSQALIAGVGNAYSDEALHRARLSPFKRADRLTGAEVTALHGALVGVLAEAVERAGALTLGELKGDKKRAMAVHGRTGLPCPVCGDTVRQVSYATKSLQYCPTCQTGGKVLADRRLSRLLK
jgi:formamidopyrimidine-DNA glycosylase